MERLEYNGKLYYVLSKIPASRVEDPSQLRKNWNADLVLTNKNMYWILREILEAEFTEIKENKNGKIPNKKSIQKKS